MLRRLLFLLLFFPISLSLQGQCMTVPESLDNLISASSLVVEGKVRSQQSYWDIQRKNIYTVNEIEVFKIFQGEPSIGTVNLITRGGVIGLEGGSAADLAMDRVSNALELEIGEMGMFLLQGFPVDLSLDSKEPFTETLYRPTEGVLGFIRYDLIIGEAQGVYEAYTDITSDLYGQVTAITGRLVEIRLWDTEDAGLRGEPSVERSVVSEDASGNTSGLEVHAGVGDMLTITGVDFGEEPGSVLFPDANSGGTRYISALPHQIRSWSSEQIVLEVPYRAGTGRIRIDKADGESLIGEDALPIGYDHINVQYTDASGRRAYETQLTSDNATGGYNFQFEADFAANTGAAQAFTSLIETWACTTGVNFQIGEVTQVDEDANDGINIVRFDNGDELGGRTLAYARSRYRGCYQGDTIKWFVNEIEVVVNDDYNWYYGDGIPDRSQFDFETVMLHEIGHTQQLGHVINGDEVMHFAVGPGQQKRALSDIDTIGGIFVTDKSAEEAVCGREPMERSDACCETMTATAQSSDTVLCPDQASASFAFEVDFADAWKWQIKENESWIDLTDDEIHAGTDSAQLTVLRSGNDTKEFRCVASNDCDETVISEPVLLSVRTNELSIQLQPASCDSEGEIQLSRTNTGGNIRISIDGGISFGSTWPEAENEFSVAVAPGTYEVFVEDIDTGCTVALGPVEIGEPIVMELAARALENIGCDGTGGQIQVDFNDHPDFEKVLLSVDGGISFQEFEDSTGLALFTDMNEGEYQVMGMWEDGSCLIAADMVSIGSETCPEEGEIDEGNPDHENSGEPDTGNDDTVTGDNEPETKDDGTDIEDTEPETGDNEPSSEDEPEMESDPTTGDEEPAMDEEAEYENPNDTKNAENSRDITLKVYPNPTTDRIYVQSDRDVILHFQLFNARGALVQQAVAKKTRETIFYMDIAHPQSGVYTLYIITNGENVSRRIIVK